MLEPLVILLYHLPLWLASALLARRLSPGAGALWLVVESILIASVLWRCETLLLHPVGLIDRGPVLLLHLLLLAVIWSRRPRHEAARVATGTGLLPTRGATLLFGAAAALLIAAAIFRIAALPDPYDALTYHLMLPAAWIETGRLVRVSTWFGDIAPTYTPAAVEGFFLALMLPTASDVLARVGQLPFQFATLFIITAIAARGRGRISAPMVLVALACQLPWYPLIQASGSMVDSAAACFFLAALWQLLLLREDDSPGRWLFAGSLLGLFLGSRVTSVPLSLPLLLFVLAGLWRLPAGRLRVAAPLAAGVLLTGLFPYLRNFIDTGNPLYPLHLELGSAVLLPGLFTREAMLKSVFHLDRLAEMTRYLWIHFGFGGALWLATGASLLRLRGTERRTGLLLLGSVLLILTIHFAVIPYNTNMRFLFPAWGCLAVAAARATETRAGLALALGGVAVTLIELLHPQVRWPILQDFAPAGLGAGMIVAAGGGALLTFAALHVHPRWPQVAAWLSLVLCIGACVGVGLAHQFRMSHLSEIESRDPRYRPYVAGWRVVDRLPVRSRVAYSGLNLPYPLRGNAARHHVVTVPLNGAAPGLPPHGLAATMKVPRAPSRRTSELQIERMEPQRDAWLRQLEESQIDFLVLYLPTPAERPSTAEYAWARALPQRFSVIYDASQMLIYRVAPRTR